ncbi:MAG TPA: xanthine dehydrogenase family protein subunit M [Anaerolineales bacterium]|nr:xanthine dehydrogenase family protein subunit M [Anaerolineales bacterium]
MKPAAFEYIIPESLDHLLQIKAEHGDEAKPLAGGQSLIPAMNFRMARPSLLVDLNRLPELAWLHVKDGELQVGTMTRMAELQHNPTVAAHVPLIAETVPHIAHPQIRNRGSVGGNLAHADPASELPVVAVALGARFRAISASGERWIPAHEFFLGTFTTSLQPQEILLEVTFPTRQARTGYAFAEVARRHGDYAMAGVVAVVSLNAQGQCDSAQLVYLNAGDSPTPAVTAAAMLIGNSGTPAAITAAAQHASMEEIAPYGNLHASTEFQRHLARHLTQQALKTAFERARAEFLPHP